jgi:hypothetical protein
MDVKIVKNPPGMDNMPEPKLDATAIPDIDKLLSIVLEFLHYIGTKEMQELENRDQLTFERHLDVKFEDLSLRHYPIFKLLIDKEHREENVCKLIDMFSILAKVKSGALDINQADKNFNEDLNNEYIYPKFGGKQQFEQAMLKGKNKKKNKKH